MFVVAPFLNHIKHSNTQLPFRFYHTYKSQTLLLRLLPTAISPVYLNRGKTGTEVSYLLKVTKGNFQVIDFTSITICLNKSRNKNWKMIMSNNHWADIQIPIIASQYQGFYSLKEGLFLRFVGCSNALFLFLLMIPASRSCFSEWEFFRLIKKRNRSVYFLPFRLIAPWCSPHTTVPFQCYPRHILLAQHTNDDRA